MQGASANMNFMFSAGCAPSWREPHMNYSRLSQDGKLHTCAGYLCIPGAWGMLSAELAPGQGEGDAVALTVCCS